MTSDNSLIEELLAIDALGGLDPQERELLALERASHGTCEQCARFEAEFTDTAGRLAFALDPIPVDRSMADEILRRAARDAPVVPVAGPGDLMQARDRRKPWRALTAVAAALAFLVASLVLRDAARGGTAILVGEGPERLAVTFTPGEPGATVSGTGFAALPQGRVYELWAIRNEMPIRATCFISDQGHVDVAIDTEIETGDVMAVTVEDTCATSPTAPPIITADTSQLA